MNIDIQDNERIENILDQDTFSIVVDFLSDDLNFLYYLKQNGIKPKGKDIIWDNFNWADISNDNLSWDFIDEFKDRLNWNILTDKNKKDIDFIRRFQENVDWYNICSKLHFDDTYEYDFFDEFSQHINWSKISRWDWIAEDFIDRFNENLDWDVISGTVALSRYLIEKYYHNINWNRITSNRAINKELVEEFRPIEESTEDEDIDIQINNNSEQVNEDIIYEHLSNSDSSDNDIGTLIT